MTISTRVYKQQSNSFDLVELVRARLRVWFSEPGLICYRDVYRRVCITFSLPQFHAKQVLFELARRYPGEFKIENRGLRVMARVGSAYA